MKRMMSLLLALGLLLSLLPVVAGAEEMSAPTEAVETVPETEPSESIPEETDAPETETVPMETEETTPDAEETIPEETISEETISEETIPEETIPEETVETLSSETEETVPEETEHQETLPEGLRFELPEADGEICDFENRIQPPYYFYRLKLADEERVKIYEGDADIFIVAGDSVSLEGAVVTAEKAGTTVLALTGEGIPLCNTAYVIVDVVEENRAVLDIETSLVVDFQEPELGRDETMGFCYEMEEQTMELEFNVSALGAAYLSVSVNGGEWESKEGSSAAFTAELENRQNIIGIRAFDDQGRVATFYKTVDARLTAAPMPEETEPAEVTEETVPLEQTGPTEETEPTLVPEETTEEIEETVPVPELTAALVLPPEVACRAGEAFTASVSVTGWEAVPSWRLMECTVEIPRELDVADVRMCDGFSGGIYWEVSESDGLLRISYASMENAAETDEVCQLFTMDLRLKDDAEALEELAVRILDMSFGGMPRVSLLSLEEEVEELRGSFPVNVENAGAIIRLLSERIVSYSAARLYRCNGENRKQAVCVSAAGSPAGRLIFQYGGEEVAFFYNESISVQSNVPCYVAVVDADIPMAALENADYFTLSDDEADALMFGDANGDGRVDAQDALTALDIWLRSGGNALADSSFLCLNINADSGVDTFDALGILEYYVNGREFPVVARGVAETE